MESVEFKKSGLVYYLHAMIFKHDPEDTCTYKRNLIITFCTLLVSIHATILRGLVFFFFKNIRDEYEYRGIVNHLSFLAVSGFSLMVGIKIVEDVSFIPDFIHWHELSTLGIFAHTFLAVFIGLISIAIFFALAALVVVILVFTYKGVEWVYLRKISPVVDPTYMNDKGNPKTQFGVLYQSAKERWCKRINWK